VSLEWLCLSYFLYSLLLAAGLFVSLPYWLFQMLRRGKYRSGLSQRLGRIPPWLRHNDQTPPPAIWLHAVSVGEVLAVRGLVEGLRHRFPRLRVMVSTTTDTGQTLARKLFGNENVFYFPLDFTFAIRPYLRALRPKLVILAETEFWPNFLRQVHAGGAFLAVVNARISDRSWPKYRRFRWALRKMLAHVDLFLAQSEEDRSRLQSLGAASERVHVTGNLKFDLSLPEPPPIVEMLCRSFAQNHVGPILVCGSTVEGEEPLLLAAFKSVLAAHPRSVMLLAPRHPERFEKVALLVQEMRIPLRRRSALTIEHQATDDENGAERTNGDPLTGGVLLVDTIGELSSLYALADIAFVGGSLVPSGGHNILEPALHGVPIVVGEHTENFRDIVGLFQAGHAVRVVTPPEFSPTVLKLLADPSERAALGRRAAETLRSQMGATAHTLDALEKLLAADSAPAAQAAARVQ
jgi:3-deoxy-D-manno-octulosonic-acid transferase